MINQGCLTMSKSKTKIRDLIITKEAFQAIKILRALEAFKTRIQGKPLVLSHFLAALRSFLAHKEKRVTDLLEERMC